jgi:hypothetical protein
MRHVQSTEIGEVQRASDFMVYVIPNLVSTDILDATFNPLLPNVIYICHTAPLTSRRYILNISSTNIRTEYFKHAA